MMMKDREQKKEQRQTMIFRKRKKAPVVKYSFDPRFAREGRIGFPRAVKGMEDQTTVFKAWTDYPAMKTCDAIRKLPTYIQGSSNVNGTSRNGGAISDDIGTNMARHNLSTWENMKRLAAPDVNKVEVLRNIIFEMYTARFKTIKSCPAIKDILTQTLLVKCPTDIHFAKGKVGDMYDGVTPFDESEKDELSWHWASPAAHLAPAADPWGEHHPKIQFCYGENSHLKDYCNLKINTGIMLEIPDHITAVQHAPVFHKIDLPMTVIPGIFTYPVNKSASLIPNFFIHKDQPDFILKKGDPLFYLTFSEFVKLEENTKGADQLVKFTFDGPQLSWRNLSGKLRTDGKD